MALGTVYSDVATLQQDPNSRSITSLQKAGSVGGKTRFIQASYSFDASAAAADDIIRICKLNPGDVVLPAQSKLYFPAQGTGDSVVLDIGHNDPGGTADPDAYADGLEVAAGGFIELDAGGTLASGMISPYFVIGNAGDWTTSDECWLEAKIVTYTGVPATDGTIYFYIAVTSE
jgi:hypothetical protein